MLGIHEAASAALFLRFGDDMQRKRGLARGLRPENLDNPAARQSTDAERDVEPQRSCGNRLNLHRMLVLSEPHDGAFAEVPLDLTQRGFEGFLLVHVIEIPFDHPEWRLCHKSLSFVIP